MTEKIFEKPDLDIRFKKPKSAKIIKVNFAMSDEVIIYEEDVEDINTSPFYDDAA